MKNFSYTFAANLFQLIISSMVVLVIPRYFGVKDYSFWQLYLLYFSYVGMLQIGWCDGVYLRHGGKHYHELNKNLISSQVGYVTFFYILISSFLLLISNVYFYKSVDIDILIVTLISGFLTTPRGLLFYVLQGTNQIIGYVKMMMLEKIIFIIALIASFILGFRSFEYIILSDLIGKLVSLIGTLYICRDVVFIKYTTIKESILEAYNNINVGIKLMFANIASSLIIGIVRLSVERNWGLEVFGKVSLTLSISNLFMVFINSVGIVMFPILRRISTEKLELLYGSIRNVLMVPLLFLLIFYYPMKIILSLWLPQYAESLEYMALLFPMIIFESKTALLINTYLKTLRQEKKMLFINILTVAMSGFITFLTVYVYNDLTLVIGSIVFLLAFRSIVAEFVISRIIKVNVVGNIFFECILVSTFMFSSWIVKGVPGILLYLIVYCFYLFIKKDEIKHSLEVLRKLTK